MCQLSSVPYYSLVPSGMDAEIQAREITLKSTRKVNVMGSRNLKRKTEGEGLGEAVGNKELVEMKSERGRGGKEIAAVPQGENNGSGKSRE